MDGQKDIKTTQFLAEILTSHSVRTNPFGESVSAERAYRRAERITAAIYLLTNHIGKEEPIRREIRQRSLGLLEEMLTLKDELRAPSSPRLRDVQSSIRGMISLTRMLAIGGYVSPQNNNLMIEALDELGGFLRGAQRSNLAESSILTKESLLDVQDIGQDNVSFEEGVRKQEIIKDKISIKDIKRTNKTGTDVRNQSDKRGEAITDVLKRQGSSGIKDVAAQLPEYSEKMIQRELARLIDLGRVKKVGFKRWSKYEFVR